MNAETRIYEQDSQRLYKKVGKKYVPVSDPYAYSGLREGWWLVRVKEGCTSISPVYPARAEIKAAVQEKIHEIVPIIRRASEARPKEGVPLSEQAKKDWEWFISRHGKEFNTLYYPSFNDNAVHIVDALMK